MEPTDADRLHALEMAVAHQDKVVEELNAVVTEQWTVIDTLRREIERLRDRIGQLEYEGRRPASEDAPPPHY